MILMRLLAPIITLSALFTASAVQAENYSPAKVIAAMRVINPRLKIIVAHRGLSSAGCPENSGCAINRVSNAGIEAVEIDVKESADGTLWPSHDVTVGRGTDYSTNGHLFSPWGRNAANDANNPTYASLPDSKLRTLKLRDPNGDVTRYLLEDLDSTLRTADISNRNLVYVLDLKYPQSVRKAANIIKKYRMEDRVILKFSVSFFEPTDIVNHTLGLHFAPTIYAGNLDYIAEHYHIEDRNLNHRVFAHVNDYRTVPGFVYYEIGNKEFTGPAMPTSQAGLYVTGPLAYLTYELRAVHAAISNFIPIIEHFDTPDRPGTGFFHTDGSCCTRLEDFLSTTRHFGNETRDDRGDIRRQVVFNESVIIDYAGEALFEAKLVGARADVATLYY